MKNILENKLFANISSIQYIVKIQTFNSHKEQFIILRFISKPPIHL